MPFYEMLRLVPHKLIGVFVIVIALFILALLPFIVIGALRRLISKGLSANMVSIGFAGRQPISYP